MIRRRRFLEGAGLTVTTALAGCTDGDGSTATDPVPEGGSDTAETGSDDSPDEEPSEEDPIAEHAEIDRGELEARTRATVDEEIEAAGGPDDEGQEVLEETDETDATGEGSDQPREGEETDADRSTEGENGGNDGDDGADGNDGSGTGATEPSDGQEANGSTDTPPQGTAYGGTVRVQVDYDGDWVFAYSTRDRTSSFIRSDLQTLEIGDDLDVVSIAVQKADDSDGELTALVLLDGGIVADGTTTDPFGIAEATHSVL